MKCNNNAIYLCCTSEDDQKMQWRNFALMSLIFMMFLLKVSEKWRKMFLFKKFQGRDTFYFLKINKV
jgi:hypothetical protein